jgi:ABC-2 type transport system permease protein
MSTAALPAPGLDRLTRVELRKMLDTRAGTWLAAAVLLLTAGLVVLVVLTGNESDHVLDQMLNAAVAPASLLLPIVGILLVTSEWSQRTTLTTFALVPRRGRVIAAKVLASVALSLVAFGFAVVAAVVGTALSGDGAWTLEAGFGAQIAVYLVASTLIGTAVGAALLRSAPAIVIYFALPIAWAVLTQSIHALDDAGRWLDLSQTIGNMTEHPLTGTEWARVATSLLLWLALPLAIGTWRIVRGEVN